MGTEPDRSKELHSLWRDSRYSISGFLEALRQAQRTVTRNEVLDVIRLPGAPGMYVTPGSVAKLMADLVREHSPKEVLDPSCGTCAILSRFDANTITTGYDIDPDIVALAQFLHPGLDIRCEDFLSSQQVRKYGAIVSNFPVGRRERGRHMELAFLDKCLDLLAPGGVLVAVLPNSFFAFPYARDVRQRIMDEHSLEMVVALSSKAFPRTAVDFSLLTVINRPQRDRVFLADAEVGAAKLLKHYHGETGEFWVSAEALGERWDRHYHNPEFKELETSLDAADSKPLDDIAEVRRGVMLRRDDYVDKGKYLVFSRRNVREGHISYTDQDRFVDDLDVRHFDESVIQPGDVLVSLIFDDRTPYIVRKSDPPAVASHNYGIIRSRDNEYIRLYLASESGQEVFAEQARRHTRGGVIRHLSLRDLRSIRIPIVPLDDPNRLSNEHLVTADRAAISELRMAVDKLGDGFVVFRKEMHTRFDRVDETLNKILRSLQTMQREMTVIRRTQRDDEEKLKLIYGKLDQELAIIAREAGTDIDVYVELLRDLILNWDKLDDFSKESLPLAEYLLDRLQELDDADYSPVILQYCRGVENEFLRKLFASFTAWIGFAQANIAEFLASDLDNKKTSQFAKSVMRYQGRDPAQMKYTLGEMVFVLGLAAGRRTIQVSPLLQAFKEYAADHFDLEVIFSENFLGRLRRLTEDYRNKCAHPYKLAEDAAISCKDEVRADLDTLLESWGSVMSREPTTGNRRE